MAIPEIGALQEWQVADHPKAVGECAVARLVQSNFTQSKTDRKRPDEEPHRQAVQHSIHAGVCCGSGAPELQASEKNKCEIKDRSCQYEVSGAGENEQQKKEGE